MTTVEEEQHAHKYGRAHSLKTDKPLLYIDLDGVCANYGGHHFYPEMDKGRSIPDILRDSNIFENLPPIEGAVEAVDQLFDPFDLYFATAPIWDQPDCYMGKRLWVEKMWGDRTRDRLILTGNKGLLQCWGESYLVDDTLSRGVVDFKGEHIFFDTKKFPNWKTVLDYLLSKV